MFPNHSFSFDQTSCSLIPENTMHHMTTDNIIRHQDGSHVIGCQYRSQRVIRIVSLVYIDFVFPVPNMRPHQNQCEQGIPCKVRPLTNKPFRKNYKKRHIFSFFVPSRAYSAILVISII